jgi:di/tricarboxylate transporter
MTEHIIVFGTLLASLALFVWGRWRYDVVALVALFTLTVTGIVDGERAFAGFGHPAVITVAAVLVISRSLGKAGLGEVLAGWISRAGARPSLQVAALTGFAVVLSSFMNNVGALALLMPVALSLAQKSGRSVSLLLMPLAFGTLLGGMTTLIGTPPNLIISTFRGQTGSLGFGMFDFTPVGVGVALVGLIFVSLVGWRLIPQRKGQVSSVSLFDVKDYLTEVHVSKASPLAGKPLRDLETVTKGKLDVTVVGIVRGERTIPAPSAAQLVRADDVLIVEADSQALQRLLEVARLELAGSKKLDKENLASDEIEVLEVVIASGTLMEGRTATDLNLRRRFGVNLLAVARQGERLGMRLGRIRFQAGDVLLLQADPLSFREVLPTLGCLPLQERGLRLGQKRSLLLALSIFAAAIAINIAGLLPAQVSLMGAALLMVLLGLLSLREAYESINWPILILIGAMLPVGVALETSGGAQLIASGLLSLAGQLPPAATLAILLVGTMCLTDIINNSAAAVLLAPIAVKLAQGLEVSADPFLMAVAIGASCAFLTPIGHQANTLVMGPGGYKFGDYWRLGLPLEILIVIVAIPLLLAVWPL